MEATEKLGVNVSRLTALRNRLLREIPEACPSLEEMSAPDLATEKVWSEYDQVAEQAGLPRYNRTEVQRLLRRAHDPSAVVLLLMGYHRVGEYKVFWALLESFQNLLKNTPLPRLDGKTLDQVEREMRRTAILKGREGAGLPGFMERFVERVSSPDPGVRKEVRKEMEKLRHRSADERWGKRPDAQWRSSRELLQVWDGVRAVLDHPDRAYRRAALCALPFLQFSFVTSDLPEECEAFVVKGLQDPDGMVRHKVMRFGKDFFMMRRLDQPEVGNSFESAIRELLKKVKRVRHPAAVHVRKLLKEIAWFRGYDVNMGWASGEDDDPLESLLARDRDHDE